MSVDSEKKAGATEAGAPNLLQCNTCGRNFAPEALARHNPICKKIFNKKRKPFNSLKQRIQGTDIPTVKKKPPVKNEREKKSNWRQQHEDFISTIRAAKLATLAMKEGRPLPPPPPPSINPDYIQCPYCMRRFNQTAAERHINFCKEQAARRPFAPSQKAGKSGSGKQGVSKKDPTLTNAVGTLLQNRLQGANTGPSPTGHSIEISTGAVYKKISPISSATESGLLKLMLACS
ncbi:zinc finger C2HC domain-containing protein 1B [Erythrolamprus reginae]|uniref:zinc finger C2HC domain-containing protein 1B n=1 Tax=Erythrolamprus reginae TaxID=121349 RepID=UPI00396CB33C